MFKHTFIHPPKKTHTFFGGDPPRFGFTLRKVWQSLPPNKTYVPQIHGDFFKWKDTNSTTITSLVILEGIPVASHTKWHLWILLVCITTSYANVCLCSNILHTSACVCSIWYIYVHINTKNNNQVISYHWNVSTKSSCDTIPLSFFPTKRLLFEVLGAIAIQNNCMVDIWRCLVAAIKNASTQAADQMFVVFFEIAWHFHLSKSPCTTQNSKSFNSMWHGKKSQKKCSKSRPKKKSMITPPSNHYKKQQQTVKHLQNQFSNVHIPGVFPIPFELHVWFYALRMKTHPGESWD